MRSWKKAAILAAAAAIANTAPGVGPGAAADDGAALMRRFVDAIGTGDQTAFEKFVRQNYAPAALADSTVEDQADRLARLFTDTGGFTIERIAGESPNWIQAEARDRTANIRYCLTLKRARVADHDMVTDFSTRGIYPAGVQLQPPSPAETVRTIRSIADAYDRRGLLSGVVLIAKDDKILFEKAYGWASLAYDRPMTLATRLNIASIAKRFTGVAIGQLVDAGKLSYDDPVGKLLPDYPDKEIRDRVTVRQLLSHTSGMGPQDYYEKPIWATARPHLRNVADYMKIVIGTPIGAKPGQYLYSNSGYVLLGAIIERLSGQSFYDYVEDHIFKPAGMRHSFYHVLDDEDPDVAVPLTNLFSKAENSYVYRLGRPRSAIYELAARGGSQGGAYVTAGDLFAFERALSDGKLVSRATLAEMTKPQSPSGAGAGGLGGDVREGLGVEVVRQNGHVFFGHTGGDLGIASLAYSYPDMGYTTIVLTNRDPRAGRVLANATRALLTRHTIDGATPPPQTCIPPSP
jgi:CubicO group peptidase (beta-lactamase class C family)